MQQAAESNDKGEGLLRTTCVELGLSASIAGRPITGDAVKKLAVPNTLLQAWYLGRGAHLAKRKKTDLVNAIFDTTHGRLLYGGKMINITRKISRGYTIGRRYIAPTLDDELDSTTSTPLFTIKESRHLVMPFQNEYLYAAYIDPSASFTSPASQFPNRDREEFICTVPDLISILGQDGEALGSPELRYWLKVKVIATRPHPLWTRTEKGLKVFGGEGCGWRSSLALI
jgi:DUF917 family protein